ncbi:MAG: hypothetical protein ABIJ45_05265 [Candidatus Zixiibacteriota bacterium]
MTEKTRKLMILSLLPIAIIWAIYNMGGKEKNFVTDQQELAAAKHNVIEHLNKLDSELIDKYSKLSWGSDPFFRGTHTTAVKSANIQPGWHLAGIIYNETNPHAVINNKIVQNGDSVDGAEIITIEKDRVVLQKNGSEFTLSILRDKS